MLLQSLIARFGLATIFAGAAIEGETVVIAGGVLAHQHFLTLPGVMVAGALGSFAADQAFFVLGRHFRHRRWVEKFLERPAAERALATLERHPTAFILGFRFLYGLRTVSPIVVGTSDVPQARFLPMNALAAALWAILFASLGYALGGPLGRYFPHPNSLVLTLLGGLLVIGLGLWLGRIAWKAFRRRTGDRVADR
ncbi:DedA family protein [Sphingomonas abietis]|uniref:DedA family protein n=1 Tax=Sphingomonas abietis TaxID=3012344 RepID=A0ABY7NWH7_9SPHN|nr:DedA family protein [Sphingomonas abietis]WBO24254.1 DedA family protein [Sphingomonas abietis]